MKKLYPLFGRLMGGVADWALAYILFSYLCSFDMTHIVYREIGVLLPNSLPPVFTTIATVYLLYIFLRLYITVLIGVSLGQWLMGIRSAGYSFSWKRIGGGGRVLVSAILWPLLVFDLPLLWKRRTFKEIISFTHLEFRGVVMPVISSVIIIPSLLMMSLFSPLLENLTLIDGVKVKFTLKKKQKISSKTNFKSFKNYSSNFFKFSTFSSLGSDRFVLIPSFEVIQKGETSHVNPFLNIYDREGFKRIQFKTIKKLNLFNLLEKARTGNPLFNAKYPQLARAMNVNRSFFQMKAYDSKFRKSTLVKIGVQIEIERLIQSSFELSLKTALNHLISNGPFARGYIVIRNELLQLIDQDGVPEVSIVHYGNYRFLKMIQTISREQSRIVETLIPLGTMNSLVMQLSYKEDMDGNRAASSFKDEFLTMIDWYFDYTNIFSMPTKRELNPLSIIDYFAQGGFQTQDLQEFEDYIYEYFFSLCRESLVKEDPRLKELLLEALDRYHAVALLKNSKGDIYYSERFVSFLKTLKVYLENENKGYFNY